MFVNGTSEKANIKTVKNVDGLITFLTFTMF